MFITRRELHSSERGGLRKSAFLSALSKHFEKE